MCQMTPTTATDAYLISGALVHFGMSSVEHQPTKNIYESIGLDEDGKRKWFKLSPVSWKSMLFTVCQS